MRFAAAPEYEVFPGAATRNVQPYKAAVWAADLTRATVEEFDAEVVIADILTIAAALAAERAGRPVGDARPARPAHPRARGCRPSRSVPACRARGRDGSSGARSTRSCAAGSSRDASSSTSARRRVGLPPLAHFHGGISRQLALVATFPQLEYPRPDREPWVTVTGPLMWEQPYERDDPPPGDAPLVLVAPSTSQDPDQRMLRAALEGLAGEPVRVLATTNRRPPPRPIEVPAERHARRLGLLRADDAALRRGHLPCGARNAHARPERGGAGRRLPGRGRHGARTPLGWHGPASASRCPGG